MCYINLFVKIFVPKYVLEQLNQYLDKYRIINFCIITISNSYINLKDTEIRYKEETKLIIRMTYKL